MRVLNIIQKVLDFFKSSCYLKSEEDVSSGFGRYSQTTNRLCGLKLNYNCTCKYRGAASVMLAVFSFLLFKQASYPLIKYFHSTTQLSCHRRSVHRVTSHQCPLLLRIFSICRSDSQITFILSPLSASRNLFNNNNRRQWRFILEKISRIFKL